MKLPRFPQVSRVRWIAGTNAIGLVVGLLTAPARADSPAPDRVVVESLHGDDLSEGVRAEEAGDLVGAAEYWTRALARISERDDPKTRQFTVGEILRVYEKAFHADGQVQHLDAALDVLERYEGELTRLYGGSWALPADLKRRRGELEVLRPGSAVPARAESAEPLDAPLVAAARNHDMPPRDGNRETTRAVPISRPEGTPPGKRMAFAGAVVAASGALLMVPTISFLLNELADAGNREDARVSAIENGETFEPSAIEGDNWKGW